MARPKGAVELSTIVGGLVLVITVTVVIFAAGSLLTSGLGWIDLGQATEGATNNGTPPGQDGGEDGERSFHVRWDEVPEGPTCVSETYTLSAEAEDSAGLLQDQPMALQARQVHINPPPFSDITRIQCGSASTCSISTRWSPDTATHATPGLGMQVRANVTAFDGESRSDIQSLDPYSASNCPPFEWHSLQASSGVRGRGMAFTLEFTRYLNESSVSKEDFSLGGIGIESAFALDNTTTITVSGGFDPPEGSELSVEIVGEIEAEGGKTLTSGTCSDGFDDGTASTCSGASSTTTSGGGAPTIGDIESACGASGTCSTSTFPWLWLQADRWGDEMTISNNDQVEVGRSVGSCSAVEVQLVGSDLHLWNDAGSRIETIDGPFSGGETVETRNGDMVIHVRSFSDGESITLVPRCGDVSYSSGTTVDLGAEWISTCQSRYSDQVPASTDDFTGDDLLTCAEEISADCVSHPDASVIASENCDEGVMSSLCSVFSYGGYTWAEGCHTG